MRNQRSHKIFGDCENFLYQKGLIDHENWGELTITQDDIYTKADEYLYIAKENGRNRLECVLL